MIEKLLKWLHTPKIKWYDVNEARRVYYFSRPDIPCHNDFKGNYDVIVLNNVVKIGISCTTHRVHLANGEKYIIPNNFRYIEVDTPDWKF